MEWTNAGLSQSSFELVSAFELYEIDFSAIPEANHHPNFQIRITFDGPHLTMNNGDRVTFNNIAVEGVYDPTLSVEEKNDLQVTVSPNPTSDNITIQSDTFFDQLQLFDLS